MDENLLPNNQFSMKKIATVLLLINIVFVSSTQAQRRSQFVQNLEVSFGTGMVNFLGDLGGASGVGTNFLADFNGKALRPLVHVGARYRYNEFIASKVGITFAWLDGSDANTKNDVRRNRNLSFQSPLLEFGTTVEFYWLPEKKSTNKRGLYGISKGAQGRPVLGYISSGINGFWFNPMARWDVSAGGDGKLHALQPLGTEGQGQIGSRDPYSRVSYNIPINLGIIVKLNNAWNIECELGYRRTFTDYIDDVSLTYVDPSLFTPGTPAHYFADPSLGQIPGATGIGAQRGDPTDPDTYIFLNITATWKLSSLSKTYRKPKY